MIPSPQGPRVVHGDCLEIMKMLPDCSVDSIVTDPPYGLGFMGKAWDALPPGEEWAAECLRVLKPGGHLLAFGGSRTWHRLAVAVEDAGFEIRDSIAWLYGSGFPKHRAALKPAFEPVVLARKPFKGSLAANEAEHGTGALSIDACRIAGAIPVVPQPVYGVKADGVTGFGSGQGRNGEMSRAEGRWPANVVLDDTTADMLDQQSGMSPAKAGRTGKRGGSAWHGMESFGSPEKVGTWPADLGGGASRFFYVAKAPKRERPVVDEVAHPTVKPLALMRWLVRLVTPEGGTVLDPFAGSGTTVEACILENLHCIAIEREAEYLPLIQARINRQEAA